MQFLQRNRYALLTVAVLILASVLVVRQRLANLSLHTQRVEDFLLLYDRNQTKACEHLYQLLIQQLPYVGDRELVQDLQRTAMIIDPQSPQPESLVWKYQVSVRNELKRRSERRVRAALEQAAKE